MFQKMRHFRVFIRIFIYNFSDFQKILIEEIDYYFSNVKIPLAAYVKKPELGSAILNIKKVSDVVLKNSLISKESFVTLNGIKVKSKLTSSEIIQQLYGNLYGTKTIR